MKVFEVLQKQPTHKGLIPIKRLPAGATFSIASLKQNFIGSGYQTDVFKHPKRGQSVVKLVHIPADSHQVIEGAVWYVNAVLQNQDNPFFPRIHKAKIYQTAHMVDREMEMDAIGSEYADDYQAVMFVESEKLLPVTNPKLGHSLDDMLEAVGITKKKLIPLMRIPSAQMTNFQAFIDGMSIGDMMGYISVDKFTKIADITTNPELAKAIHIIHEVVTSHQSANIDLKDDNFMVRITSVGPQLVLNDPIV